MERNKRTKCFYFVAFFFMLYASLLTAFLLFDMKPLDAIYIAAISSFISNVSGEIFMYLASRRKHLETDKN